ncbi:MAG: hypothetical protein OHK93_007496 [Ramalina farinacea]|uniref:Uncharacterized protein n=1 Tax=Ramalina farinacea TaxID=258253 RepID=A0AA43TXN0_9LECA|nr:hypothetical protein [Ramalina farinacea]
MDQASPLIARVQEHKEHEIQKKYTKDGSSPHGDATAASKEKEAAAARTLQRTYRGYRDRRQMRGLSLDPASRWTEAIKEAQYRSLTTPRSRAAAAATENPSSPAAPNDPFPPPSRSGTKARSNWAKAGMVARRANADEESSLSSSSSLSDTSHDIHSPTTSPSAKDKLARQQRKLAEKQERVKSAKTMDLSYFLEMVDTPKHRYGSNLRKYHAEWQRRPTNENFFYWLDHGAGMAVELPNCSRKRLEDMQVRYLNREERMLYEVVVGDKGKLCWRKDGVKVDTTREWRDSVEGIVREEDPAPLWADRPAWGRGSSEGSSSGIDDAEGPPTGGTDTNMDEGSTEKTRMAQELSPPSTEAESKRHPTLPNIFKTLSLSKQPDENTAPDNNQPPPKPAKKKQKWIFVADTKNNLYISLKQSGAFQHSSFLHGARVSVAGLIHVRDGQLRILQPRSGHYRTPSHNLHVFIKSLQARGVDMGFAAVGGTYVAMVGIEGFMKGRGRWRGFKERVRGAVKGKEGEEEGEEGVGKGGVGG